jgi:hypothetical protein
MGREEASPKVMVPWPFSFSASLTRSEAGCEFQLVFEPTAPGDYTITLVAGSDLGGTSSLTVTGTAR